MKTVFTCFLALLIGNILSAKTVDLETAKRVGINFYYEKISRNSKIEYHNLYSTGSIIIEDDDIPLYYAINMNGDGWVVVSAEDAVTPILAYSFEGSFTNDNQPPQFIAWMHGYAQQIKYTHSHMESIDPSIMQEWEHLSVTDPILLNNPDSREVTPMLLSTWDQGVPYNLFCPQNSAGPGGRVWAGCVATAMCQIMYYYRWPNIGNGQHCYTPSGYPEQCANFSATTYNWEEMMNSHGSASLDDTAMAILLWHAGISVNMMYSPSGSGAYSEDAVAAMIYYFRYSPTTQFVTKDQYSEDEWAAILRENLDNQKPLYYRGYGSGGHAFNVDGYQGTNYFHFNWGWSGSYNGYYYLNNLNPGGNNFTEGQGAIINIFPDTLSNIYPENCTGQHVLDAFSGTIDDGSGPTRQYLSNSTCSWLISPQTISDSVSNITVSFNKFKTEAVNDVLRIYEGETTSDQLLAEYSGDNIPPSVTINSNKALITFSTNGSIENDGWFLTYIANPIVWCSGLTGITENDGIITDGSLDFNYKNKTYCHWKIIPGDTGALTLTFTSFNTEQDHDILKIFDMGSEELITQISGNYSSGNMPGPYTAPSGRMYLVFSTNSTVNDQGWEAYFSVFPVGIQEKRELSSIQIFPNPAADYIIISGKEIKSNNILCELFDLDGKSISKQTMTVEQGKLHQEIFLTGLLKGMYLLKLVSDDDVILKKIVIR